MSDETEPQHERYEAYRYGEKIGEGPTPVPDDIAEQATEIRWSDPSQFKNEPLNVMDRPISV